MLRATIFSLVFMVAAGPSLPTFCKAWCATQAAEVGCHHGSDSSTSRIEEYDNSCQVQVPVAATYKEDTRRRTAPDEVTVWAVTRSTLRAYLSDHRPVDRLNAERSGRRSTLRTPLRI